MFLSLTLSSVCLIQSLLIYSSGTVSHIALVRLFSYFALFRTLAISLGDRCLCKSSSNIKYKLQRKVQDENHTHNNSTFYKQK